MTESRKPGNLLAHRHVPDAVGCDAVNIDLVFGTCPTPRQIGPEFEILGLADYPGRMTKSNSRLSSCRWPEVRLQIGSALNLVAEGFFLRSTLRSDPDLCSMKHFSYAIAFLPALLPLPGWASIQMIMQVLVSLASLPAVFVIPSKKHGANDKHSVGSNLRNVAFACTRYPSLLPKHRRFFEALDSIGRG
jgi:hypothetical protein